MAENRSTLITGNHIVLLFKVFTEFLQYCLFYLPGFRLQGTCNLSSPTGDQTCIPCIGRQRTARKSKIILFLIPCELYHCCVSWDVLFWRCLIVYYLKLLASVSSSISLAVTEPLFILGAKDLEKFWRDFFSPLLKDKVRKPYILAFLLISLISNSLIYRALYFTLPRSEPPDL